jgi:hypothetical protein
MVTATAKIDEFRKKGKHGAQVHRSNKIWINYRKMRAEFEGFICCLKRSGQPRAVSGYQKIYRDERGPGYLLFWAAKPLASEPVNDNVVMKKRIYLETRIC